MVVLSDDAYVSSSRYHASHVLTHRRYPSTNTAVLKEFPHRGTLLRSQENLLNPGLRRQSSFAFKSKHIHRRQESDGVAPTIVSSIISPTVSRKPSIQQKRRFMMSRKEVKNKFYYPVKGPRRLRSKRGKYRNRAELDASLSYIDIDSSMSKDLCFNQNVMTYHFKTKDLLKVDPQIRKVVKVITVDSKNNYILYTPDPTPGKNSVVTDAEQILNQELRKLGKPVMIPNDALSKVISLPQYRVIRPNFQRYDTFPVTETPALIRTRSLPSKSNDEKLEALWNLYLRRVIAARIKWRLTHSSQEYLNEINRRKRMSMASSVDTGFFMNQQLQERRSFPCAYRPSPEDSKYSKSTIDGELPSESAAKSQSRSGQSSQQSVSTSESSKRQVMLDSLEELMAEVTSIVSHI